MEGSNSTKDGFFACEVGTERILTIDNSMKNDRAMANVCYLRKQVTKTYNYLLLWCPIAYSPWSMVYNLLSISWIGADSVREEIWGRGGGEGVMKRLNV